MRQVCPVSTREYAHVDICLLDSRLLLRGSTLRVDRPVNEWGTLAMNTLHLGGFQEAAETLSVLSGRGYSRQAVHQLWKRRDYNGFPDRNQYRINGTDKLFFNMEDIRHWYETKDQVVKREEETVAERTEPRRLLGSILSDSYERIGDPRT